MVETSRERPPFVLREPVRGSIQGREFLELSGIERVRGVLEGKFPQEPVARLTGLHPTEVGMGMTTFAMPVTPWWQTGATLSPSCRTAEDVGMRPLVGCGLAVDR
jgi:hypothetical protein